MTTNLGELMALLAKAGFTRLVADYLPENEEGFPVGWRIHDHPENSHVANMICDGIENEEEAVALAAAVNFCRTELPALIEREKALREACEAAQVFCSNHGGWFENNPWTMAVEVHAKCSAALAPKP